MWHELTGESIVLPLFFHSSKEAELITKFLPMLMSFVVDDRTFNVDQKLPSEEKGPVPYPSTIPEAFTKCVICLTTILVEHPGASQHPTGTNPGGGKMKNFLEWDLVLVN